MNLRKKSFFDKFFAQRTVREKEKTYELSSVSKQQTWQHPVRKHSETPQVDIHKQHFTFSASLFLKMTFL